jgi:sensor histidine kinase YesM
MEKLTLEKFLDARNWRLHSAVMVFSVLVVLVYSLLKGLPLFSENSLVMFIILLIQLELFFAIAVRMFKNVKPGNDRKKTTQILLSNFALFMLVCFVVALVLSVMLVIITGIFHGRDPENEIKLFFSREFIPWMRQTIGGLLFGAAVFIYVQWQDALKREQKLREENLIFQNETLKSQINPHFLFNSLNTMASLISTRPESAQLFISKLASIYRYIIENSIKDSVPLETELDFIRDYFFLYQIRDENKISLDINIGNYAGFKIMPVSLQSLVENAIKHNKATKEEPLRISVYLEGGFVVVSNNLQKMATQFKSTGTGLKNLSERARLATGKSILVEENADSFTVKIPLLV